MSDPTPAPVPTPTFSAIAQLVSEAKTFALGIVVAMVLLSHFNVPTPGPVPTPVPIPVPVPPGPGPIPTPVPVPIPPTPTPTPIPVVGDFFRIGQAYGKALAGAYGDAWDRNFQIKPGDDVDARLGAVKADWDLARGSAFGATVAPALEAIAPNRKAVDQATADALNKARTDFTKGLRNAG